MSWVIRVRSRATVALGATSWWYVQLRWRAADPSVGYPHQLCLERREASVIEDPAILFDLHEQYAGENIDESDEYEIEFVEVGRASASAT